MSEKEEHAERRTDVLAVLGEIGNRGMTEERHSEAVLRLRYGKVFAADGVLLPNGQRGKPTCITQGCVPFERSVWLRRLGDGPLGRRGRLVVDDGKDVRFVDEPDADLSVSDRSPVPDLQHDLAASDEVRRFARSEVGAALIYGALANARWRHEASGEVWSCTSRTAGGIAAALHDGGDYLDWAWHPTGELIDERVVLMIADLGWQMAPYDERED